MGFDHVRLLFVLARYLLLIYLVSHLGAKYADSASGFMLKEVISSVLICFLLIGSGWVRAQTADHTWAGSLGFTYLSYRAPASTSPLQYTLYDPGVSLSVDRYLSGAFAFSTRLLLAPQVRFPVSPEATRSSYLIDMSYLMMFKLNNGALLRESARIGPYLTSGIGGSYVDNVADIYVPLGGGIQVRISPRIAVRLQSVSKISINKDFQHVAHAAGLVYTISGKKESVAPPVPAPVELDSQLVAMNSGDTSKVIVDELVIAPVATREETPDSDSLSIALEEVTVPMDSLELPVEEIVAANPVQPEPVQEEIPVSLLDSNLVADQAEEWAPAEEEWAEAEEVVEEEVVEEEIAYQLPVQDDETQVELASLVKNVQIPESNLRESTSRPCGMELTDLLSDGVNAVYFDYGSDELLSATRNKLAQVAEVLSNCSNARLVLYGHADAVGADRDNKILSVTRGFNVKYFLVHQYKISQSRISSEGYGENRPAASNETTDGRNLNRRVEFEILYN